MLAAGAAVSCGEAPSVSLAVGEPIPAPSSVRARWGRPHITPPVRVQSLKPALTPTSRLVGTDRSSGSWEGHRAFFESEGQIRAYAVGDLLSDGAILLAIEDSAVRVMAAERVFRLDGFGPPSVVEAFEMHRAARPRVRPGPSKRRRAEVARAVDGLVSAHPDDVRRAIQTLTGWGEGVVATLALSAHDPRPVQVRVVRIAGHSRHAETCGDRVIAVLEAITGQSFGDPLLDRSRAIEGWRSWAGLPLDP